MNITGLRAMIRGSSLRTAPANAERTMVGSKTEREADGRRRTFGERCASPTSAGVASVIGEPS